MYVLQLHKYEVENILNVFPFPFTSFQDYSVKFYINEGADRNKIVLGIPTYGRSYTLLNEESTEIGAPTDGPGAQGEATREKGYLAYYEVKDG